MMFYPHCVHSKTHNSLLGTPLRHHEIKSKGYYSIKSKIYKGNFLPIAVYLPTANQWDLPFADGKSKIRQNDRYR